MSDTITRSYLATSINNKIGVPLAEAAIIIDSVFEEITIALKEQEIVKIAFFGSFYVRKKAQRIGRNPKTKEEAIITERKVVSFYPSNQLKARVNKKNI